MLLASVLSRDIKIIEVVYGGTIEPMLSRSLQFASALAISLANQMQGKDARDIKAMRYWRCSNGQDEDCDATSVPTKFHLSWRRAIPPLF